MGKEYKTDQEGEVHQFYTGAQRDTLKGKGRFDLISPFALKRLADVYERGGEKYGDRNWELGQPTSILLSKAIGHLYKYIMVNDNEDHLAQAVWNIFAIMHFEEVNTDMCDVPKYKDKK